MNKINFTNLPDKTTPINATNMNLLQTNIDNAKLEKKVSNFAGDYNNLTDIGFYYADDSSTNGPASGFSHYVTVYKLSDNFIYQVAYRVTKAVEAQYLFVRQNYNGTWTMWRAIGGKILWTNSNPSASFPTQNITLNSSDYNYLEWHFVDGFHSYCYKVPKGYGFKATVLVGEGANVYLGYRYRIITYTDATHYSVGNGYIKYVNKNNPETDTYDHIVRPLYVIGY